MATQTWTSGSCTCTLTDAGVFTVSGNGPMADYSYNDPWSDENIISVVVNNGVTRIGNQCFYYCEKLTSVTIPNSVTSMGDECFWRCHALTSVTIPDSVTSIGYFCFQDCYSLASIIVSSGNRYYDSRNNCNAIIHTSTNEMIQGCKNTIIPDSVTSLSEGCFAGADLTSVTIPDLVTSIGEWCFYNCRYLASAIIGTSVARLDTGCFGYSYALNSVIFKGNAPTLNGNPFVGVSFTAHYYDREDKWPASVRTSKYGGATSVTWERMPVLSTGSSAIKNITIGSTNINKIYAGSYLIWQRASTNPDNPPDNPPVIIPDMTGLVLNSSGTTVIGYAIRLPDTVTSINSYGLMCGLGLKYLFLPSSLTSIAGQALPGTGIKQLYIPDACSLGYTNFNGCPNVATVRFPTTGSISWSDQFVECTGVQWLVFPNRSISFSYRTFTQCINLKKIYFEGPPPSSYSGSFSGCTFAVYTKDSGWTSSVKSSFASGCGGTVTSWNTFTTAPTVSPTAGFTLSSGRYSNGTDIIVPNTITLDSSAFSTRWSSYTTYFGNNHISAVSIPSGVTTIGEYCFTCCSQLPSLTIPSTITSIKDYAFQNCVAMKQLYFEGNPPTISSTALSGLSLTIYTKSGNTKWTSAIKTSTYGGATSVTWATY